jgi:hypothetical protein
MQVSNQAGRVGLILIVQICGDNGKPFSSYRSYVQMVVVCDIHFEIFQSPRKISKGHFLSRIHFLDRKTNTSFHSGKHHYSSRTTTTTQQKTMTQGMMKAVAILSLLFALFDRSDAAIDDIATDYTCYGTGEDIHVSFSNAVPTMQSSIGIYYADGVTSDSRGEPLQFVRSCGSSDTRCKTEGGTVTFKQDSSPLKAGKYMAYLQGTGYHGYTSSASSEPFTVKANGSFCRYEDAVFTERALYRTGEDLLVAFENSSPEENTFIQIYAMGTDAPILWLHTCSSQRCEESLSHGMVSFGTHSLGNRVYYAALGGRQNDQSFVTSAKSEAFEVVKDCEPSVDLGKTCFVQGEDIAVEFGRCTPKQSDIIAIYPSDVNLENLGERKPTSWVYSCGTKDCTDGGLAEASQDDLEDAAVWPLDAGQYIAVLVPKNNGGRDVTYASKPFRVMREGEICTPEKSFLRASVVSK